MQRDDEGRGNRKYGLQPQHIYFGDFGSNTEKIFMAWIKLQAPSLGYIQCPFYFSIVKDQSDHSLYLIYFSPSFL